MDAMDEKGSAARKIRFLLEQQADDAHRMANRLGIEIQALLDIMDGKSRPSDLLLQKICTVYGLNVNYFRDSFREKPASIAGSPSADPKSDAPPVDLGPRPKPPSTIVKPSPRKASSPEELRSRERAFTDEIVDRKTRES
jgi:transcriptional regulator with XRE-family HTH domain